MPDVSTGVIGTSRRQRDLRRSRRRGASGYLAAAAAGLAAVAALGLVVGLDAGRAPKAPDAPHEVPARSAPAEPASAKPEPPAPPGTAAPGALARAPDVPTAPSAEARAALKDLDGRWSDGQTRLIIDARRMRARIERDAEVPAEPIVVRDVGARMIVADIGPRRFILVRRPGGLAVSGATLAAPLELRRD